MPNEEKVDLGLVLAAEVDKYRNRVFLAWMLLIPLLILVFVIPSTNPEFVTDYFIFPKTPLYVILAFIMSTITQFYLGAQFYSGAWNSLRHKAANMDVLVALGTTAAWAYGFVLMLMGGIK